MGFTAVGVVDLDRLLAAHPPGTNTLQARKRVLRDIKRIVAVRATANDLGLIFDISGQSLTGAPFILATNGVPDITDEVLQELSQPRGLTVEP